MNYLKLLTKSEPTGFTLLEILVTSVFVGIIAAIGISNFKKTIELEYLKGANSQIYQAIGKAQLNSLQRREYWQISILPANSTYNSSSSLEYSVHQSSQDPTTSTSIQWTSLPSQIRVDTETSIPQLNSIYQLCFTEQGLPSTATGSGTAHTCTAPASLVTIPQQITLYNKNISGSNTTGTGTIYKRCVIITTLLGAMQTGEENPSTNVNGKYCY